MERKTTTSGLQTSNHEEDNEQDARDDSDDLYLSSGRIRHGKRPEEYRSHPDRVGKYTKKFR